MKRPSQVVSRAAPRRAGIERAFCFRRNAARGRADLIGISNSLRATDGCAHRAAGQAAKVLKAQSWMPYTKDYVILLQGKGSRVMKILVIDDHVLIRQAMLGVLKKLKRDAIVLDAANYQQAKEAIAHNSDISLVLLDLNLPDRDGFSVLAELRETHPAISVVVLSGVRDPTNVRKALDLGALGYIPKSAESDVILNALRLVMSGGIYVPPELLAHGISLPPPGRGEDHNPALAGDLLTGRQMEVLALLMQGNSNKVICQKLNLTEPTVKNHVTAILRALNVSNRTEAVIAANELGWKPPEAAKQ